MFALCQASVYMANSFHFCHTSIKHTQFSPYLGREGNQGTEKLRVLDKVEELLVGEGRSGSFLATHPETVKLR